MRKDQKTVEPKHNCILKGHRFELYREAYLDSVEVPNFDIEGQLVYLDDTRLKYRMVNICKVCKKRVECP
jgi:hypothetical protein